MKRYRTGGTPEVRVVRRTLLLLGVLQCSLGSTSQSHLLVPKEITFIIDFDCPFRMIGSRDNYERTTSR